METKDKNVISIILYKGDGLPRYFNINKTTLKIVAFALPTITLVSLLGFSLLSAYFKQIRVYAQRKEPAIIVNLRTQTKELSEKNKSLHTLVEALNTKLSSSDTSSDKGLGALDLFKRPNGQQDLTKSPIVGIDGVKVNTSKSHIGLSFNIVNMTPDNSKLGGHLFIVQKEGNILNVYPNHAFVGKEMKISFNKGETFATSRFRPVVAKLRAVKDLSNTVFKILIFSRTGDLLLHKIISGDNLGG